MSRAASHYSALFSSWLGQLLFAIVVPSIVGLNTARIAGNIDWQYPLGATFKIAWYVAVVWGNSFLLALLIYRLIPQAAAAGRFVWIVPIMVFLFAFIYDSSRLSLTYAASEFFYTGSNGEGAWAMMGLTYPTCASVLYSLGMLVASRKSRSQSGEPSAARL